MCHALAWRFTSETARADLCSTMYVRLRVSWRDEGRNGRYGRVGGVGLLEKNSMVTLGRKGRFHIRQVW